MLKRLLGLSVLTLALTPAAASAATITVDSLSDPGTAGTCTLRQAIGSASNNSAGTSTCVAGAGLSDDIVFDPSLFTPPGQQTIQLSSTLGPQTPLLIAGDMTITGPGANELAVHGYTDTLSNAHRVVDVDPTRTATISDLEITGGDEGGAGNRIGGGIRNQGDLTLTRVLVEGNQTRAQGIGGSTALSNGGGIANFAVLTLNNTTVTDNPALATNNQNDAFSAVSEGGGIYSEGDLHIHSSSIDSNTASAADTGVILNAQDPIGRGGGVEVNSGTFDADHSSFSENEASGSSQALTGPARGDGGGIAFENFSGATNNRLELSTVAFNTTSATAQAPVHHGSGVDLLADTPTDIVSSTIAYNGADPAGTTAGANVNSEGGTASFENTIIANPLVSAPTDNCANGSFTSNGHNLEFPAATGTPCYTPATGDTNADPKLAGALALNGGSTNSLALLPGSGAIDVGSNAGQTAGFLGQDQRGLTRPVDFSGIANGAGNGSDIGAFEVQKDCVAQAAPGASCSPPATTTPPGPTGQRAKALKKCKKKKSKKARKKCKKHAKKLPV
jgi:hypothetical protein